MWLINCRGQKGRRFVCSWVKMLPVTPLPWNYPYKISVIGTGIFLLTALFGLGEPKMSTIAETDLLAPRRHFFVFQNRIFSALWTILTWSIFTAKATRICLSTQCYEAMFFFSGAEAEIFGLYSIVASPEKGFKKHERKNNVYMVFFVRLDKQNFTSFSWTKLPVLQLVLWFITKKNHDTVPVPVPILTSGARARDAGADRKWTGFATQFR